MVKAGALLSADVKISILQKSHPNDVLLIGTGEVSSSNATMNTNM